LGEHCALAVSTGPPSLPKGYGWTSSQQEPPGAGEEPDLSVVVLDVVAPCSSLVVVVVAPAQATAELPCAELGAGVAVIASMLRAADSESSPRERYMRRMLVGRVVTGRTVHRNFTTMTRVLL
jgi:hypothetical protein